MSLTPLYSSSAFGVTTPDSLTLVINLDESVLGTTDPEVATAVRHLCGLLFEGEDLKHIPLDDYYDVARDYYERFRRDDSSGTKSLVLLCYVSTYFHELRHVHDLLATKYGQSVFFQNLNFYQNVPALVAELAEWQGRNLAGRIPLPLTPYLSEMQGLSDDVRKLVARYPTLHADIEAAQRPGHGFHSNLSVRHLLECCATNVQIDFINDVFGQEAFLELMHLFSPGSAAPEYWQINNDMVEAFYAKGFRGGDLGRLINYIAWCALFGTKRASGKGQDGVSIIVLYEALVEHILHKIGAVGFAEVRAMVDDFCRQWGFLTPAEMVADTQKALERQATQLEKLWRAQTPADDFGTSPVSSYKRLTAAYADLNERIALIPEQYFGNYAWAVLGGVLPGVRVLITLDKEILHAQSRGHELLPLDSWDVISHLSATLKLLLEGRSHDANFSFLEKESFNNLIMHDFDGIKLRFRDRKITG
jgi:hypothetical protein